MGGGGWSSKAFDDAKVARSVSGAATFAHTDAIHTGKVAVGAHKDLDPKRVAGPTSPFAGQPIRESRDSVEHPESVPVAVFFDVTGSMGQIPVVMQDKLPKLMEVVKDKGGIDHPQVLVGAVGDYHGDSVPFQVGFFESDNRFDEQLRNIYIERGGGGQIMESYGLPLVWAANFSAHDAFDKRGKRGFLFTIGDEAPHMDISATEIKDVFGVHGEATTVKALVKKVADRYHYFHLRVDGSYPRSSPTGQEVDEIWSKLLGERLVYVPDPALICEVIAGIVHMIEGSHTLAQVLKDLNASGKVEDALTTALAPIAKSVLPAHIAKGSLPVGHDTDLKVKV